MDRRVVDKEKADALTAADHIMNCGGFPLRERIAAAVAMFGAHIAERCGKAYPPESLQAVKELKQEGGFGSH